MNPQDVHNISSWLQEILNLLRDTHTQLEDLRNENRQMLDDLRGVSARVDQKDTEIIKTIDTLKGQMDVLRGDLSSAKSTVENRTSNLESRVNDIKSTLNDVRRAV